MRSKACTEIWNCWQNRWLVHQGTGTLLCAGSIWMIMDLEEIDVQMTYAHLDTEDDQAFQGNDYKGRTEELVPGSVWILTTNGFLIR